MRKKIESFFVWCGIDEMGSEMLSWFAAIGLILFFAFRLGSGMKNANDEGECIVRSVNDVLIAPFYALGCNMAKDRFNYKLN